MEEGSNR